MTAATERSAAEFAAANITSGDVAVICIPDGRRGEIVRAVVVPRLALDTRDLSIADLITVARKRLTGFKCPTGVSISLVLRRDATQKVLRGPSWPGRDRQVS